MASMKTPKRLGPLRIARRLREVDGGHVKTIPWPKARRMIAADEQPDI